jgi:hypothetical protein
VRRKLRDQKICLVLPVERIAYYKSNAAVLYRQNHAVCTPLDAACQRSGWLRADFHDRQDLDRFPHGFKSHGDHVSWQMNRAPTLANITIV